MASRSVSKGKKKRPKGSSNSVGFGKKDFKAELKRAVDFLERDKLDKAHEVLLELNHDYPDTPEILVELANYYAIVQSLDRYQVTCEQLTQLDPKQPIFTLGLANSYLASGAVVLALKTFQTVKERWPEHQQINDVQEKIDLLQSKMDDVLAPLKLPNTPEGIEVAAQHDRVQRFLERGEFQEAYELGEALLEKAPETIPIYNNVSLGYFLDGHLDRALEYSQKALEKDANNIHALANLIRFHFCQGDVEAAQALVPQLLDSSSEASDPWVKKMEALSYLGDYEKVLEVYGQAQASGDIDETRPHNYLFHLAAVAMARLGQKVDARAMWQDILKRSPGFQIARSNFNDCNQPLGAQHGAWSFAFNQWISPTIINNLLTQIRSSGIFSSELETVEDEANQSQQLKALLEDYLQQYPLLNHMAAVWLERGGPDARQFAWMIVNAARSPQHLEAIKSFALGQWGPDEFRYQAAIIAAQEKVISKKTCLWLRGEWKDVTLMAYDFHDEPEYEYPDEVLEKLQDALNRLKVIVADGDGDDVPELDAGSDELDAESQADSDAAAEADAVAEYAEVERLLKECLVAYPDGPDIRHNLAVCYQQQGRVDEAIAIWKDITDTYPDYVYSRTGLARLHLQEVTEDSIQKAKDLLFPLLERDRFHYDHFSEFSDTYLQLLMVQGLRDGAKNWLDMWAGVDPENPLIMRWFLEVFSKDELMQRLQSIQNVA